MKQKYTTCVIMDPEMAVYKNSMRITVGDCTYGVSVIGDGEPIVCFHGFSESGNTWDNVKLVNHAMYRIDCIGHGQSDKPRSLEPYTIPAMLEDMHTVINLAVGDKYALMGYSMGARLALLYALQYGDEVQALVLESGSVGIADETERQARVDSDEALAQNIESLDSAWFANMWANVSIFASQQSLPDAVKAKIQACRQHNQVHALANTLRGSGQGIMPYVGDELHRLPCRTLYVSGSLDTKYDGIRQSVFEGQPNVTTHCIEGAGHNTHIEQPEEFSAVVLDFLRD